MPEAISPPYPADLAWPQPFQATLESLSSRTLPRRSRVSAVGQLVTPTDQRRVVFQSMIELHTALRLLADPSVETLIDQPPAIAYMRNGRQHRHTFDFLAILSSGERVAVACKASMRAELKDLAGFYRSIAHQIPRSFATRIVIFTELSFFKADIYNAGLLHDCSRDPIGEADAAVAACAGGLYGRTTLGAVVEATGLGGDAFRAAIRAIRDRALVPVEPGRWDYDTRVAPPANMEVAA
ncbi:hypothetical protein [uncultured Methylobacterium sp.]|uniref:hypothetical protein n=1 Tax=uncultured Methylobacterium sp. TaxID=157278 RepID=UPI0025934F39|nr:hypothetical protein [uncultured Methylobacterium sp.]